MLPLSAASDPHLRRVLDQLFQNHRVLEARLDDLQVLSQAEADARYLLRTDRLPGEEGDGLSDPEVSAISDAPGTGNADMLDGQHGAYYVNAGNLTGTLADARLTSNIPKKDAIETIGADCWAFTNGLKERGRTAKLGDWTAIAYASGNFTTSNATTWTVEAGDQVAYRYMQHGHTVRVRFQLSSTAVGVGNPSAPYSLVAAGLPVAAHGTGYQRGKCFAYFVEDDLYHQCLIQILPSDSVVAFYYVNTSDVLTPWPEKTITLIGEVEYETE